MRINLISVEDSVITMGFRKMASFTKSIHPDTGVYFIPLGKNRTFLRLITGQFGDATRLSEANSDEIKEVARPLADADIIGFSSMTAYADVTRSIIEEIRRINPKAYIIWGGIHPIIHPEDAIKSADAICTGEGEYAFEEFISLYKEGKDFSKIKNFWFNQDGKIIRNDFLPLHSPEDFEKFPFTLYADECELIYRSDKGFIPMTLSDYLNFSGTNYTTIWSIGCPYRCTYCGNTKFIDNDKDYRKLRHPSVNYIVEEVKAVRKKHPHITSVMFYDDSFMAIPKATLIEFAEHWKKEVNLPFVVMGVIPSFVKAEKLEILIQAGMNRLRMGIQSGSDRILEFYQRPNKEGLIAKSAATIADYAKYMIPPAYDIIVDNPIETRQDVIDTLELLYNLKRPYTIDVFSLKIIPNTTMEEEFLKQGVTHDAINSNYLYNTPTFANALLFLLTVFRPPRKIFEYMLKFVKPYGEKQTMYPVLFFACRFLWLVKRAINHLRFMDFSTIPGRTGWIFWKVGIIKLWHKMVLNQGQALKRASNPVSQNP